MERKSIMQKKQKPFIQIASETSTIFENLFKIMYQEAQNQRINYGSLSDRQIYENILKKFGPDKVNYDELLTMPPDYLPNYKK